MPDDYSADRFTTGAVEAGGSARGTIETAYDEDWFAVELVAGRTYQFDLTGSPGGGGTLPDTYFRAIYNSAGRYQSGTYNDNFEGSRDSRVTFTPEESGTYYARVSGDRDEVGTYTLSVRDMTPPEAGNPPPAEEGTPPAETSQDQDTGQSVSEGGTDLPNDNSTPGRVAVGGSATGTIGSAYDLDRFAVELVAGRTYQFDLTGRPGGGGTLPDTYFRAIYNSAGRYQSGTYNDNFEGSRDSRVTFTPEDSGTYYARVSGDRNETGSYTLTVTDVTPQHAPAFAQQAYVFALEENADGSSERVSLGTVAAVDPEGAAVSYRLVNGNGSDRFTLDATSGELFYTGGGEDYESGTTRYALTVRASDGTLSADMTVTVNVTDVPDEAVDSPADPTQVTGPEEPLISALQQSSASEPAGTDFSADDSTEGRIAVDDSVTGTVGTAGDVDWFAVELVAGKPYRFLIEPLHDDDDPLKFPRVHLRSPAGEVLESGGLSVSYPSVTGSSRLYFFSEFDFVATETATHYVAASNLFGVTRGAYHLSVSEIPDDYADSPATSGSVDVGGTEAGEVDFPGDHDWFAVDLQANRTYRLDLEGSVTDAGTLGDPHLSGIFDSDGTQLPDTTDGNSGAGRNSRLTFTPTEGGTYYVAAGGSGNYNTGTYQLSVIDVTEGVADDYSADENTSGRVAVGGSTRGLVEYKGDVDWFAVTLEGGTNYQIDVKGNAWWGDYGGTLEDPYLYGIHDAGGNFLPRTKVGDGGDGGNSRLWFKPDTGGTYYVAAGAQQKKWQNSRDEGSYTVAVTDLTPGAGLVAAATVGKPATGSINFEYERDWFGVTLEAGTTYQFDLKGYVPPLADPKGQHHGGSLRDPWILGIYDEARNEIPGTGNNNGGYHNNSRVTFTPTEDGDYYLMAGAYGRYYFGTYTLLVDEVDTM